MSLCPNNEEKRDFTLSTMKYTLCPKKVSHLMFDNNLFHKCGPIFKILSPSDTDS